MLDVMEEPSGIPVEAVEERPSVTGRGKAKLVDWQGVQDDYCLKCLPAKEVAEKYGVRIGHIYQRAHRYKWPTPQNQVQQVAAKAVKTAIAKRIGDAVAKVEPEIARAVKEWQDRTLRHAGRTIEKVGEKLEEPLELEELKAAASTLDVADRVGRRALGLDREASGSGDTGTFRLALGVRLELLTSPAGDVPAPVIDVDPA